MTVDTELFEATCKNMIKTILACLENATKGTVYSVGPMPELRVVRITSGRRVEEGDEIEWGLPAISDYNTPGKTWEQYKDKPGSVQEAMGWCVEEQKSWTAENPYEDTRSVRKQLCGEPEDFYHMEPVLIPKSDLYGECPSNIIQYPLNRDDRPIWQDTEYIVAGVVKIHFKPYSIKRDDRFTKVIRELSRSLGTEFLSLHIREALSTAQKEFARHRLESCKLLAHELRNTLIKFGFIFSAVNAQIGILRESWEEEMRKAFPDMEWKECILARLNDLARHRLSSFNGNGELSTHCRSLLAEQEELADLSLLPNQGEQWVLNRIRPKWEYILSQPGLSESEKEDIRSLLEKLRTAVRLGCDEDLIGRLTCLPADFREKWKRYSYLNLTPANIAVIDEIIPFLDRGAIRVPHRHQIKKCMQSLKALIEIIPEVEEKANRIISSIGQGAPGEPTDAILTGSYCTAASTGPSHGGHKMSFAG